MRAVVCGAGIAGLAVAHGLVERGWDVTLLEQAPEPRDEGYMVDFFGLGYDAAESLGLLPRLRQLAYPIGQLLYVDEHGRRRAAVDYDRFARAVDGRLLSLMRPDLELALRELVGDAAQWRYGCRVVAVDDGRDVARVTLTDGTVLAADLVVGADGIHSTVREQLVGAEERFSRHLGLHTAAFRFRDAVVRGAIGDDLVMTDTPDATMGLYALRDDSVAAFAVHRGGPRTPPDPRAELRRVYGSMGWVIPATLERCPPAPEIYYDHVAQIELPRWHGHRTVLVGDAAYAVSLVAGQGASLAVAGAVVLTEELGRARSVPEALAAYQRRWQPTATARQRAGRRSLRWFLPSTGAGIRLRRAVLRLSATPVVSRVTARAVVGRTRLAIKGHSL